MVDYLRRANGTVRGGVADDRPAPAHAEDVGRLMTQHEQLFCAQPSGPDSFHPTGNPEFRDGDDRLHLNLSPRGES